MTALIAAHLALVLALGPLGRRLGQRVFLLAAALPAVGFGWLTSWAGAVAGGRTATEQWSWAEALGLEVQLRLDGLSLLMALIITGVGAVTLLYARWYFAERDEGLGRTAAVLVLFVGSMLLVAFADNLLMLYVAWELTTVCSFLLIGDDGRSPEGRGAALRALLATTGPGFLMLLGFLVLGSEAGTFRISELVSEPPTGGLVPGAIVLVLVGAFAKCAQIPFHPWLPEAMVAPTPVSAYLHAAAMVKAGVYLIARLGPGFADVVPWQPLVVGVGLATMLLGGWRALAQTDLKRLLAFGTIAQLGFLVVLLGAGTRTAALAGATMLLAHALFKACLFLIVGIIDHAARTRDVTALSGVGRNSPALLASAVLAGASMVGLPPFIGYLGKEAALEAFHSHAYGGGWVLAGLVLGSVLTVAYTCRFLWEGFAGPVRNGSQWHRPAAPFVLAPAVLALAGLVVGLVPSRVDSLAAAYADQLNDPGSTYHLALWHGFSVVVVLSAASVVLGVLLYLGRGRLAPVRGRLAGPVRALAAQDAAARWTDRFAGWSTEYGHVRGLPRQLTRTVLAVSVLPAALLVPLGVAGPPHLWDTPWQAVVAAGALAGAVAVIMLRRELMAAVVLGVVGYLVAVVFVIHGAPDVALAQVLVETLTFVVFVLVLRRAPESVAMAARRWRPPRLLVAIGFGATMAVATLAMSSRHSPALPMPGYLEESPSHGGPNVVNVILTEYRALDTLGEVTVLVIAATAVASLVLRRTRMGGPPRPSGDPEQPAGVSGAGHD